ncbi:SDR family NAD(P)-dependent oxidoreductase [Salinarimonas chemoclinalis]|uniref:SDR family NAD(P)-dependent oxidoreductase n=1 Tax=Salinarimonas chemoclinalis TaxID=3241599 RepID=UPI003557B518
MVKMLEGRTALVTGAGLGLAIARRFAAEGARGVGVDRAAPSDPMPEGWRATAADVTDEDALAAAFAEARRRLGRLDVVVANAGLVPPWRETEHLDLDEWDRVFAVNVRGVAATLKHAVPLMKARGGAIVVMASLNARRAHPRQALYTATKHAVLGVVRAAAADLGRYGIRVNAIGPGPVATDALLARIDARAAASGADPGDELAALAGATHLRRIATEDDVADTALVLASDLSRAVTGQLVPVDGGLS